MIKYIIWFFVAFGCGILFFCLGIYSNKRKTPMNFYSGKTIKETEIKDIRKYNKANSILWKAYSLPFFISGIIYIWNELIAIIILSITCTIGLIPLTIIYEKIYRKCKAN